jgi:hypothetical protein
MHSHSGTSPTMEATGSKLHPNFRTQPQALLTATKRATILHKTQKLVVQLTTVRGQQASHSRPWTELQQTKLHNVTLTPPGDRHFNKVHKKPPMGSNLSQLNPILRVLRQVLIPLRGWLQTHSEQNTWMNRDTATLHYSPFLSRLRWIKRVNTTLTSHLQLLRRIWMCGYIPPLPHIPTWRGAWWTT